MDRRAVLQPTEPPGHSPITSRENCSAAGALYERCGIPNPQLSSGRTVTDAAPSVVRVATERGLPPRRNGKI